MEVCKTQAVEGDFGELFAAVCVFCRQKQGKLVADIFESLDVQDDERVQAVTDALKFECPQDWRIVSINCSCVVIKQFTHSCRDVWLLQIAGG